MISKILKILSLQPQISKVFSRSLEHFFLRVGQNNFGNKIPMSTHTWFSPQIPKLCKQRTKTLLKLFFLKNLLASELSLSENKGSNFLRTSLKVVPKHTTYNGNKLFLVIFDLPTLFDPNSSENPIQVSMKSNVNNLAYVCTGNPALLKECLATFVCLLVKLY